MRAAGVAGRCTAKSPRTQRASAETAQAEISQLAERETADLWNFRAAGWICARMSNSHELESDECEIIVWVLLRVITFEDHASIKIIVSYLPRDAQENRRRFTLDEFAFSLKNNILIMGKTSLHPLHQNRQWN